MFPDKGLYIDNSLVKISQIPSFSERKAKVLCGHVVKNHKNHPSGYSEKGLCILSSQIQKEKRERERETIPSGEPNVYFPRDQATGISTLSEFCPRASSVSQTEKTGFGNKGASQLA